MVNISRVLIIFIAALLLHTATVEAQQKPAKKPAAPKKISSAGRVKKPVQQAVTANYGTYSFTFTALDGKVIHLSDYAGKVVLVNIWAPWCGPCRMETPGFVGLYDQYKNKGFEILGVAVQTNETEVRAFIEKYKVRWPIGIKDDVAKAYGTYGLPDSYLFRPDGSLVKRFVGYAREDVLKPLVEEALKSAVLTNSH